MSSLHNWALSQSSSAVSNTSPFHTLPLAAGTWKAGGQTSAVETGKNSSLGLLQIFLSWGSLLCSVVVDQEGIQDAQPNLGSLGNPLEAISSHRKDEKVTRLNKNKAYSNDLFAFCDDNDWLQCWGVRSGCCLLQAFWYHFIYRSPSCCPAYHVLIPIPDELSFSKLHPLNAWAMTVSLRQPHPSSTFVILPFWTSSGVHMGTVSMLQN